MKVKNINGTSDNTCTCGSWLKHWQKYSGQTITLLTSSCPVLNCTGIIEVGAHVQKDSLTNNNWYIIPLCKNHNAQIDKTLNVSDIVKLVSANVANTCGK